jgi:hypothetical protein
MTIGASSRGEVTTFFYPTILFCLDVRKEMHVNFVMKIRNICKKKEFCKGIGKNNLKTEVCKQILVKL